MTKNEFLAELRGRLSGLSEKDIDHSLEYYAEMIEDRMEDGISEEEAVRAVGTPADAAAQIFANLPFSKLIRARLSQRRAMRTWEIILLALGAPIWLSLLIAAFSVFISIYAVIWSVAVAFWAVVLAFALSAVGGILISPFLMVVASPGAGLTYLGAGLLLGGLSILCFFPCLQGVRLLCVLSKRIFHWIKSLLVKKEVNV